MPPKENLSFIYQLFKNRPLFSEIGQIEPQKHNKLN